MKHKNKGFTLIELLVVISIIAVLSSVVMASVASAREKAKVAAFSQNLREFSKALGIYKLDTGFYPYENDPTAYQFSIYNIKSIDEALNTDVSFRDYSGAIYLQKALTPSYIEKIPSELFGGVIYYNNESNALSYQNGGLTCEGDTINGFLLLYIDTGSFGGGNISLPHAYQSGNLVQDWYCITGQN